MWFKRVQFFQTNWKNIFLISMSWNILSTCLSDKYIQFLRWLNLELWISHSLRQLIHLHYSQCANNFITFREEKRWMKKDKQKLKRERDNTNPFTLLGFHVIRHLSSTTKHEKFSVSNAFAYQRRQLTSINQIGAVSSKNTKNIQEAYLYIQ